MKEEIIFIDGLILKKPSEKAPKWILWNISIKTEDFIKFIQEHDNGSGWLNIDVKEGKSGKVYCSLNTYNKNKTVQEEKYSNDEIF